MQDSTSAPITDVPRRLAWLRQEQVRLRRRTVATCVLAGVLGVAVATLIGLALSDELFWVTELVRNTVVLAIVLPFALWVTGGFRTLRAARRPVEELVPETAVAGTKRTVRVRLDDGRELTWPAGPAPTGVLDPAGGERIALSTPAGDGELIVLLTLGETPAALWPRGQAEAVSPQS